MPSSTFSVLLDHRQDSGGFPTFGCCSSMWSRFFSGRQTRLLQSYHAWPRKLRTIYQKTKCTLHSSWWRRVYIKNVARAWTYETACALGIENEIDPNLPWNDYFEWFGPRYRLEVPENNMEDLNTKDGSLDIIRCVQISKYLCLVKCELCF
jgi:hypothetical protein